MVFVGNCNATFKRVISWCALETAHLFLLISVCTEKDLNLKDSAHNCLLLMILHAGYTAVCKQSIINRVSFSYHTDYSTRHSQWLSLTTVMTENHFMCHVKHQLMVNCHRHTEPGAWHTSTVLLFYL